MLASCVGRTWGGGREGNCGQNREGVSEPCQVPSQGVIRGRGGRVLEASGGDSIMKMRLPGTPASEIRSFCRVLH